MVGRTTPVTSGASTAALASTRADPPVNALATRAVTASSGAAASRPHGQISGVVPHNSQLLLMPHLLSRAAIRT